jgi:hypothetical protein
MNFSRYFFRSFALHLSRFAFIAALSAVTATAGAADPKADYERLRGSVQALSAALSRDPVAAGGEVKASLAKVTARQKEAEELAAIGEFDTAKSVLDEGYKLLTRTLAAVKSGSGYSGPSGSAAADNAGDTSRKPAYERAIGSARALFDAARRASVDAGGSRTTELAVIEANLKKAEAAGANSDYARGEGYANDAMKELRPLLVSMKGSAPGAATAATADSGADHARKLAAFDGRMASTKALVDALKRQNKDKAAGKEADIAGIEVRLQRAEASRSADLPGAQGMLDEAYNATKVTLQALQTPSTMKTGSAALDSGGGAALSAEAQRGEVERVLKSATLLRDAVARKSTDKGADNAAVLSRIDALVADARGRQASDPGKALQSATEANQAAKDALAKLR